MLWPKEGSCSPVTGSLSWGETGVFRTLFCICESTPVAAFEFVSGHFGRCVWQAVLASLRVWRGSLSTKGVEKQNRGCPLLLHAWTRNCRRVEPGLWKCDVVLLIRCGFILQSIATLICLCSFRTQICDGVHLNHHSCGRKFSSIWSCASSTAARGTFQGNREVFTLHKVLVPYLVRCVLNHKNEEFVSVLIANSKNRLPKYIPGFIVFCYSSLNSQQM